MPGPVAARKRLFAVHPRGVGDAAPYTSINKKVLLSLSDSSAFLAMALSRLWGGCSSVLQP